MVVKNDIVCIITVTYKLVKNIKRSKKSNYGYSKTLNILYIQRKCLSTDATDRHFGEILRYLKIKIFLFLNQKIDILLSNLDGLRVNRKTYLIAVIVNMLSAFV